MIATNRLFLFIILVAITCYSCKKDSLSDECTDNHDQILPINNCLNGYFFDQGSYWVYQDTISLQIDSVWVTSWNHTYQSHLSTYANTPCVMTTGTEKIEMNYSSSSTSSWQEVLKDNGISIDYRHGRLCPTPLSNMLDSLLVSGTMYYNVVYLNHPNKIYFFVPNVGLVRKVDLNLPFSITTQDLINHQVTLFPNPF